MTAPPAVPAVAAGARAHRPTIAGHVGTDRTDQSGITDRPDTAGDSAGTDRTD